MDNLVVLILLGAAVLVLVVLVALFGPMFKVSFGLRRGDGPLDASSSGFRGLPGGLQVKNIVSVHRSERIRVQDPATGEFHSYDRIEDAPDWVQQQLRACRAQAEESVAGSHSANSFTYTNTGETHTYKSLDEMPEDVRRLFDDARRRAESQDAPQ